MGLTFLHFGRCLFQFRILKGLEKLLSFQICLRTDFENSETSLLKLSLKQTSGEGRDLNEKFFRKFRSESRKAPKIHKNQAISTYKFLFCSYFSNKICSNKSLKQCENASLWPLHGEPPKFGSKEEFVNLRQSFSRKADRSHAALFSFVQHFDEKAEGDESLPHPCRSAGFTADVD